jgi:hypothetical protein
MAFHQASTISSDRAIPGRLTADDPENPLFATMRFEQPSVDAGR